MTAAEVWKLGKFRREKTRRWRAKMSQEKRNAILAKRRETYHSNKKAGHFRNRSLQCTRGERPSRSSREKRSRDGWVYMSGPREKKRRLNDQQAFKNRGCGQGEKSLFSEPGSFFPGWPSRRHVALLIGISTLVKQKRKALTAYALSPRRERKTATKKQQRLTVIGHGSGRVAGPHGATRRPPPANDGFPDSSPPGPSHGARRRG